MRGMGYNATQSRLLDCVSADADSTTRVWVLQLVIELHKCHDYRGLFCQLAPSYRSIAE